MLPIVRSAEGGPTSGNVPPIEGNGFGLDCPIDCPLRNGCGALGLLSFWVCKTRRGIPLLRRTFRLKFGKVSAILRCVDAAFRFEASLYTESVCMETGDFTLIFVD